MTALFGVIGKAVPPDRMQMAERRLRISESLRCHRLLDGPRRNIAALEPNVQSTAGLFQRADQQLCAVGHFERDGRRFDFAELLSLFASHGLPALAAADGSHQLALLDENRQSLLLQPDPIGSTPLFYARHQGNFGFGPDALTVLLLLGRQACIDRQAAMQFLLNRYLVGDGSLFNGVCRLGPGERLQLDLKTMEVTRSRFWDLHYSHELSSSVDAREALHQSLLASHRQMLENMQPGESYHSFLTGGMDSRGILGYARVLGALPERAITWGHCDTIPQSDPTIARQMAGALGIPFSFQSVTAKDWPLHAARWAEISGLVSDNSNSFASPVDTFHAHGTDTAAFVVLGDEAFGAGPIPVSREAAIDNIQRTALHKETGLLGQVLSPDAVQEALADFRACLYAIADRCPGDQLKDVQDYLYFHTYIARWIMAPGNFKWPLYPVRRPLMTVGVMEQVCRMAPLLRVDKRVYVELLENRFPDIAAFPRTARDSSVNWDASMREAGPFRDAISALLSDEALDRLPISESLNRSGLRSLLLQALMAEPPAGERAAIDGPLKRGMYSMRRQLSRSPALARLASRIQPWILRATGQRASEMRQRRHQIMMRLALLQYGVDAAETVNRQVLQAETQGTAAHD